ncbi:MAG: DUF4124 domain-containing protein [Halieaceae bacterium]|jgi:hypothetical protein|nr:DUF4124 domain-containing protein [Halieaceae bacterium]
MKAISLFSSIILLSLLLETGVMAQIYETVDDQGNPVFSDTPSLGSEKVDLPAANIADAPPPSQSPAEVVPMSQPEQRAQKGETGKNQVAEELTRSGALELMEECQKQREENIAPLREQAIENCVTNRRRDRAHCESFNRTFGNARPRAGGGMIRGMFWELPVCKEAVSAEKYFRMNPSSGSRN